jgi:hypothetical protein
MARLERRLRNLKARLTDRSRLVAHTPLWSDYWTEKLEKLMNGEAVDEKMPIEFLDVRIVRATGADAQADILPA